MSPLWGQPSLSLHQPHACHVRHSQLWWSVALSVITAHLSDLPGILIFICCHHPGLPKTLITIRTRPCLTAVECTSPRTDHRQRHSRQRNCNIRCGSQKCTQREVCTWACGAHMQSQRNSHGMGRQSRARPRCQACSAFELLDRKRVTICSQLLLYQTIMR